MVLSFIGIVLTMYILLYRLEKGYRKEIQEIREAYYEREKELLDRIMANNIHEFKSLTGQIPTKKSENGNFLVDRMERTIKKQYSDFE